MQRWWDDSQSALGVLDLVDGSDVVQGVGTAVLGYHALAKQAMTPLLSSTLVDLQTVHETLAGVDLAPVAKALGAATEPVMGEAASRYGELMAEQIHRDAVEGISHAVRVWTAKGVPMPMAVERAAEVVGVPARRIGRYTDDMKAVAVNPLVRMDAADRALMDFASHVGTREQTFQEVDKSINFREEEHPRDAEGRFAFKNVDEAERKERMARRSRRQSRIERIAQSIPAPVASRSLSDIASMLKPASPKTEAVNDRVRTNQSVRVNERNKLNAAPTPKPAADPKPSAAPYAVEHDVEQSFRLLPKSVVEELNRNGLALNDENIRAIAGEGWDPDFYSMSEFLASDPYEVAAALFPTISGRHEQMVAVAIGGSVPVADGVAPVKGQPRDYSQQRFAVPKDADFEFRNIEFKTVKIPGPDGSQDHSLLVYNYDWFGEPVIKNVEQWTIRGREEIVNVARDSGGRFAEMDERKKRMARRDQRRQRNWSNTSQAVTEEATANVSLSDLVTRLAPKEQQTAVNRSVRTNSGVRTNPTATKPEVPADPKTGASPHVLDFLSSKAVMLRESDFIRAFSQHPLNLVGGRHIRMRDDADARRIVGGKARIGSAKQLIKDYAKQGDIEPTVIYEVENGKRTPRVFGHTSMSDKEIQEAYEQAQTDAWQREVDFNDNTPPQYQTVHFEVRSATGERALKGAVFEIVAVKFDATDPMYTFVGDPESIKAFLSGDQTVKGTVYPVANGLDPIVDHYKLPPGYFRDDKMPASVVIIEPMDY